jgi:hypothetical protein
MKQNIEYKNYPPGTVLCIDRKIHNSEVKARQAAFVDRFAKGCNGALVSHGEAREYPPERNPWCIRGMKFTEAVRECFKNNRTFYYIDNGYIGNTGEKKIYFRIIKNQVHDIRPIIDRPWDRLEKCGVKLKRFTPGSKILLAPPSEKSFKLWNTTPEAWIESTVAELKNYTDRPIEVRYKRPRGIRMKEDTIEEALAGDIHCLITYNSVAACEAIILGKPAITLGPNAAGVLCRHNLGDIENLLIPTDEQRYAWLRHLSYSQFTFAEIANGYAWEILNSQ